MRSKTHLVATFFITLSTLVLAFNVSAGLLPDTGQTKCYDDSDPANEINPCPGPGEDFYGQDANYAPCNPHSYTKLDTSGSELPDTATSWAMVRDNVTGLIWEVKEPSDGTPPDYLDGTPNYNNPHDADNTYTWYDSNPATNGGDPGMPGDGTDTEDFIIALNNAHFGGHSNWRLPTINELSTIFDSSIPMIPPSIDPDYFPNTLSYGYWSSTTNVYDSGNAWYLVFFDGYTGGWWESRNKSYTHWVRAVRGGQSVTFDSLVDNGDGTVTDTDTGLMWEVKIEDGGPRDKDNTYTWKQALSYCENLSLAGYNDWRLPNRNELQSLVDYNQYDPSIDTDYFPNTVSGFYWSSTTNVELSFMAWLTTFYEGYVHEDFKENYWSVRAVRAGPCVGDLDRDGILDDGDGSGTPGDTPCTGGQTENCDDNCPNHPNGSLLGTCFYGTIGNTCVSNEECDIAEGDGFCSMNQEETYEDGIGDVCDNCLEVYNPQQEDTDGSGVGDTCNDSMDVDGDEWEDSFDNCPNTPIPNQQDSYPPQGNNCGDACECEGNFDEDEDQDGSDAAKFKWDFGRSEYNDPCTYDRFCYGDFDCDQDSDGSDAALFKQDFGRSPYNNPCPICEVGEWCVYE